MVQFVERQIICFFFQFLIGLIGCNLSGKQNVYLWSPVSRRHSALGHYSWGKASFFLGSRAPFGARKDSTSVVKSITEECQVSGPVTQLGSVWSVVFTLNLLHCISGKPVWRCWASMEGSCPCGTLLVLALPAFLWFQFVRLCCTVFFDLIRTPIFYC